MNESVVQIGGAVRHRPLPSLVNFVQNNNENEDNEIENSDSNLSRDILKSSIGGFIGEGQLAWRAVGSSIEVIDTQTCIRQAAWTFGAILHNTSAVVTCVCGIGIGPVTHIVVGVDLGTDQNPQGMVGVLSLRRSCIIRTFTFHHKVTNVCMITGGEKIVDPSTLTSELRSCEGLLAVATSHASLYLVDLGLDLGDEITSDEMSPASFVEICVPDPEAGLRRNKAISNHYHPMLCLSDNMNTGKTFCLLCPDDNILFEAPRNSVSISSVLYIPQIASLIIGYSFGSFQIINLNLITIDCASPYEENLPPVFSFAYQEPENDPRSFVYLWVCRSVDAENNSVSSSNYPLLRNTCSLYAMNYEKKEWIEGHGLWYQNLVSISPRFDFQTIGGIGEKVSSSTPSKMISAMTVVGTTPAANLSTPFSNLLNDALLSSEDAEPVPELSLSIFCWEVNVLSHGKIVTQHYIAIFDINQWYQSHMPSSLRLEGNNLCPYMSFHILDKVPKSADETILGGIPQKGSWSRHNSRMHCEKIWFPSALSYEFNLLTSEGLATYRCPSIQQSAISALVQLGPGAVVNPHPAYDTCIFSGIFSSFDGNSNGGGLSMVSEREHVLNTALEYHLLSLLVQCSVEFSEGRFSHLGCSSQLLLDWAWKRLGAIKNSSDSICIPLFGCPTDILEPLSAQNLTTLHQNLTYLSHISTVVTSIRDNAKDVTYISAGELEGRVQVVNLLHLHLQVTLWFYHCGLLPEYDLEETPDESSVPFPAELLRTIYGQRRKDIKKFNSLSNCEILLIDSIIGDCGQLLKEVWDFELNDGASLYPPPSLHSFLSMYLCPGIPTSTKHRIVQYLFLDLTSLFSDNQSNVLEELVKFPSSFSLSPSLIKLTQAFWQIDHKDFQAGLSALLDPLVNPSDITLDQHRRIIKAFLYQGEVSLALTYAQKRQPPKFELEDIRMNLSLMLANGRVREAFHYQRKQRVTANAKEFLYHLFEGCQESGRLESIIHLPLSPVEEEYFISYLKESKYPCAQDLLLIYYLQQSRFTEISSYHDGAFKSSKSLHKHQKQEARSAIVQGYLSHLPDIRNQMSKPVKSRPTRTLYAKPRPLSAHIRQLSLISRTPKSRASLRSSLHSNVEEFKNRFVPYTPFRSKAQRRSAIETWTEEVGLEMQTPKQVSMDLTRVVFPKNLSATLKTPIENVPTFGNGLFSKDRNHHPDDISKMVEGVLRKSLNFPSTSLNTEGNSSMSLEGFKLSQDIISLLKTPPVKRTSFSTKTSNYIIETPQSILKVRKFLEDSHNVEAASPIPTFPLHRLSSKSNHQKSMEKFDTVIETGSLTPKQLRFDLPHSGKVALEELSEEKESPPSMRRKRRRTSSSDTPSPRQPLPRFSIENENINLKFGPSPGKIQNELNKGIITSSTRNLTLINSEEEADSPQTFISKSKSIIEFKKDNSRVSLETNNSNISHKSLENNLTLGESCNSSESVQEDSFHSVEDYQDRINKTKDNVDGSNYDQYYSNEVLKLTMNKSSNASTMNLINKLDKYIEQNSSTTAENLSSQGPKNVNIYTRNDTLNQINSSTIKDGVVNYLNDSDKLEFDAIKLVTNKDLINDVEYNNVEDTKLSTFIKNKVKNKENISTMCAEENINNTSHGTLTTEIINENMSLLDNQTEIIKNVLSQADGTLEYSGKLDTIAGLNENLTIPCKISQPSNITNTIEQLPGEDEKAFDTNYVLRFSDSEESNFADELTVNEKREDSYLESLNKKNILIDDNTSNTLSKAVTGEDEKAFNTNYVLTFSDSEESNFADELTVNEKREDSNLESLNKKNIPIDDNISITLSKAATEDEEHNSNNISVIKAESKYCMKTLPSDLGNISTFCMTTKEQEMFDMMMPDQSLSLKTFDSTMKVEKNLVHESVIPVLEFSESEEEEELSINTLNNSEVSNIDCCDPNSLYIPIKFSENYFSEIDVDVNKLESDSENTEEKVEKHISSSLNMTDKIGSEIGEPCNEDEIKEYESNLGDKAELLNYTVQGSNNELAHVEEEIDILSKQKNILKTKENTHCQYIKETDALNETSYKQKDKDENKFLLTEEEVIVKETESTILLKSNSNNNNIIPKEINVKTEVRPNTPSRGSSILKRLDPDAIIETNYPSTPTRRSRRLSGSTPSKYVTPAGKQKNGRNETPKKTNEISTSESINGHIINESEYIPQPLVVEKELKLLAEETSQETSISKLNKKDKDDKGSTPVTMKEKNSEENNSVNHVNTQIRRSTRLSGSKENLEINIDETLHLNKIPKNLTPKKMIASKKILRKDTPPRSRRKSGAENNTVVEPILETIQEGSELFNSSLEQEENIQNDPKSLITTQIDHQPQLRKRSLSETNSIIEQPTLHTPLTPLSHSRRRSASESELNAYTTSLRSEDTSYNENQDISRTKARTRRTSEDLKTRSSLTSSKIKEENNFALMSPENNFERASIVSTRQSRSRISNSHLSSTCWRSLQSLSIPEGFETTISESPIPETKVGNSSLCSETDVDPNINIEIRSENDEKQSPLPSYQLLDTDDVPSPKLRQKTWKRSRSLYRRRITSIKALDSSNIKDDTMNSENKRPKKKFKKVSKRGKKIADAEKEKIGEKESSGFSFQNPEEIISISQAVSDVFKKLTEEHEKIVSENFVFSPPLSFSERRRKNRQRRKPPK